MKYYTFETKYGQNNKGFYPKVHIKNQIICMTKFVKAFAHAGGGGRS
jgi:hypothetical protein